MCKDGDCSKAETAMSVDVETAAAECAAYLEAAFNKFNETHRLKLLKAQAVFVYSNDEHGALGGLTIEAKDDVIAKAIGPMAGALTAALLKSAMSDAKNETSKSRTLN